MSKIVRPKTPFEFCAYPVLKEALEKTNYNQTELAQSLGTSQFTVSAWVRGDRDTTVRLLLALDGTKAPGNCRFTVTVTEMTVMGAIQIIPCTDDASVSLRGVKEWKR